MSAEENVATILRFHDAMEASDREALDVAAAGRLETVHAQRG
ncbi:MAG TPA: hypothetical protein VHF58_04435 [Solirubrobacterales bacterium]|nr:hypothetical protein [Solirubrobacterales bacterium]